MPKAIFLGLGLCAAACSGDGADTPDAGDDGGTAGLSCEDTSGTRLRRVVRAGADGSRMPLRLHDTELGETCYFGTAEDGSTRCIPYADGSPVAVGRVVFGDNACTAAIAELAAPAGAVPPRYLQDVRNPDGCGLVTYHHILGDPVATTPGVTTLYSLDGTACNAFPAGASSYVQITGPLPPDRLVAGTVSYTASGRLQVRQVDGADGSRACNSAGDFRDSAIDEQPCTLGWDRDGTIRCFPHARAATTLYSDMTCDTEIEVVISTPAEATCGAEPAHAIKYDATCPSRSRYHELTPLTFALYERVGAECRERVPGSAEVRRGLGAEVDPNTFASLTRDWVTSPTRLHRGDLVEASGLRVFRGRMRDTALDAVTCTYDRAADGAMRCLPLSASDAPQARIAAVYRDPNCAQAARVAEVDPALCAEGAPRFVMEPTATGTRVFAVGEPDAGPLYRLDGVTCVSADPSAYYQVGAEIPAAQFVGGTEEIE